MPAVLSVIRGSYFQIKRAQYCLAQHACRKLSRDGGRAAQSSAGVTVCNTSQLSGKPCMTEIYLHIDSYQANLSGLGWRRGYSYSRGAALDI